METEAFSILQVVTETAPALTSGLGAIWDMITSNAVGIFYTGVGVICTAGAILKRYIVPGV